MKIPSGYRLLGEDEPITKECLRGSRYEDITLKTGGDAKGGVSSKLTLALPASWEIGRTPRELRPDKIGTDRIYFIPTGTPAPTALALPAIPGYIAISKDTPIEEGDVLFDIRPGATSIRPQGDGLPLSFIAGRTLRAKYPSNAAKDYLAVYRPSGPRPFRRRLPENPNFTKPLPLP